MTQIEGVIFEECATDALVVEATGILIPYCNLSALRRAKAAANRPQATQDLVNFPPATIF